MNTISSISNVSTYNQQIVNKVAEVNSTNLANNAANQSAFSSYIGQAFAQIGLANPTNSIAPVVSETDKTTDKSDDNQEAVSTFIQNLFDILSQKDAGTPPVRNFVADIFGKNTHLLRQHLASEETPSENMGETSDSNNEVALAAYDTGGNATTVGNIVTNLQTLVRQLNDENRNTPSDDTKKLESLKNGFQAILNAQGANSDNTATLGGFLLALAQNLEGQSPLGIIINTFS